MSPAHPESSTAARVVAALREAGDGSISGEALAQRLGVSRAAIWKAISGLRGDGFVVEAVSGQGYRLVRVPDRVRAELVEPWLMAKRLGRRLVCLDHTESTMSDASLLARAGEPEGTVVVAETQEAGRGRRGRVWHSPPGLNLYFSLLLRPALPTHRVGPLTLVVGLALARAVEGLAGVSPRLKWPNDLHCGGRKLAGILTELSAELDAVHHVVVGVGVNVNADTQDFPEPLRGLATSLCLESGGRKFDRAQVLAAFLSELEPAYDRFVGAGLEPFLADIESRSASRGRTIEVEVGNQRVTGIARGIRLDGALIVELAGGEIVALHSGEIVTMSGEGDRSC